MPGAYIVLAVVFGLLPWLLARVSSRQLIAALLASVLLDAAGLAAGAKLYPWTDIPVAAIAATGGVLAGRAVPPRFRPMALLLLVLAALDTVQILATATSPAAPAHRSAASYYLMFVVATSLGNSAIGIFDLLLIAAMAEHWRRRGAGRIVAAAPGCTGLLLAYLVIHVVPRNLPLVPFLLTGFLLTQAAMMLRARTRINRTS